MELRLKLAFAFSGILCSLNSLLKRSVLDSDGLAVCNAVCDRELSCHQACMCCMQIK